MVGGYSLFELLQKLKLRNSNRGELRLYSRVACFVQSVNRRSSDADKGSQQPKAES